VAALVFVVVAVVAAVVVVVVVALALANRPPFQSLRALGAAEGMAAEKWLISAQSSGEASKAQRWPPILSPASGGSVRRSTGRSLTSWRSILPTDSQVASRRKGPSLDGRTSW
jgi:hypothetical protein